MSTISHVIIVNRRFKKLVKARMDVLSILRVSVEKLLIPEVKDYKAFFIFGNSETALQLRSLQKMWYIASKFPSEQKAGTIYTPLQEQLKHTKLTASVFRLMVTGIWHVAVLGDNNPNDHDIASIYAYLSKGIITPLPRKTLDMLAIRRGTRLKDAQPLAPNKLWTETHKPVVFNDIPDTISSGFQFRDIGAAYLQYKASAPSVSFLEDLKRKPFIIAYQQFCEVAYGYEWAKMTQLSNIQLKDIAPSKQEYAKHIVDYINKINNLRLRRSKKYLFTPSAIQLHESVAHYHNPTIQIEQRNMHTWLECFKEQETPYGKMRALFFSDAYPLNEIGIVAPSRTEPKLYNHLVNTYSTHNGQWGLEVIDDTYNARFDFTYNLGTQEWVFLPSHKCPTGKCEYPEPNSIEQVIFYEAVGGCKPCDYCIAACKYFATWLVTALAMIDGIYAVTPDDTAFQTMEHTYTTTAKTAVGHGKNKRLVNTEVKRNVEYTLISYDVTQQKRTLTPDEAQTIDKAYRKNWLVTTPSGEIIWIRKTIKAYSRRYPTRKNGTRRDGAVTLKNDFKKRVPMLRVPTKPTIVKIVASNISATSDEHF